MSMEMKLELDRSHKVKDLHAAAALVAEWGPLQHHIERSQNNNVTDSVCRSTSQEPIYEHTYVYVGSKSETKSSVMKFSKVNVAEIIFGFYFNY